MLIFTLKYIKTVLIRFLNNYYDIGKEYIHIIILTKFHNSKVKLKKKAFFVCFHKELKKYISIVLSSNKNKKTFKMVAKWTKLKFKMRLQLMYNYCCVLALLYLGFKTAYICPQVFFRLRLFFVCGLTYFIVLGFSNPVKLRFILLQILI